MIAFQEDILEELEEVNLEFLFGEIVFGFLEVELIIFLLPVTLLTLVLSWKGRNVDKHEIKGIVAIISVGLFVGTAGYILFFHFFFTASNIVPFVGFALFFIIGYVFPKAFERLLLLKKPNVHNPL